MTKSCVAFLISVLSVGCLDTSPTLDITTEGAFERSKAVMLAALIDEDARSLEHAFRIVELSSYGPDSEDAEADARNLRAAMEPLHSMTAQEVIEHTKALPNWVTRDEWEQTIRVFEQMKCFGYL